MTNTEKVERFIAAWEARDLDAMVELVSDDLFYHNIPMDPILGKEGLKQFAAPFLSNTTEVKWDLHHIAENDSGIVLTERTDHFRMKTGKTVSIKVMGVFEFDADGLIYKWRDYFDLAEFQTQMKDGVS